MTTARRFLAVAAALASAHAAGAGAAAAAAAPGSAVGGSVEIVGDGIPQPLSATPGDAARGRALVADRRAGLCLLCHSGPIPEERFQGNLAPSLDGTGARWTVAQLRLRVANARHLNPDSLMPALHATAGEAGGRRVAAAFRSKPILDAQQVEDVVAYLATLK